MRFKAPGNRTPLLNMKGIWLKSLCTSGTDCGWLLFVAPIFFFIGSLYGAYETRKSYLRNIKGRKIYNESTNPNGYVINDLLGVVFFGIGSLFFGVLMVISILIFI